MNVSVLKSELRIVAGRTAAAVLGGFGRKCLSRMETEILLGRQGVKMTSGVPFTLRTGGGLQSLEIRPSGVIRVNRRDLLHVDFGNRQALFDLPGRDVSVGSAISLWSHHYLGYYHWIVDMLPKICRLMRETDGSLADGRLCYRRPNRPYEEETLRHLGIPEAMILDTWPRVNVRAESVTAVPAPGWHKGSPNVGLLRDMFVPVAAGKRARRRLYLSRATGRRRICRNDSEVYGLLRERGFEFIEERPRGVAEQIDLFANAECVVSPHGGAMTNMVWCEPGTLWLELAESRYYPAFYSGLAESCGARYVAVIRESGPHHQGNVACDILVDLEALRRALVRYLD